MLIILFQRHSLCMSQHVTWESHSNHILTVITVFIHYPLTMWLTCITPVSYCMFLAYTKSSPIIYVLYHVPNLTHGKSHILFSLHVLSHVSPGHMLCSIQCYPHPQYTSEEITIPLTVTHDRMVVEEGERVRVMLEWEKINMEVGCRDER